MFNEKNGVFVYIYFMFWYGERDGLFVIYFVLVNNCDNFDFWIGSVVCRVIRIGGKVIGVEFECLRDGGYSGEVKISVKGGVIFFVGIFGFVKFFMCSKFFLWVFLSIES